MKKQKQDIIDQSLKIIFNEGLRSFTVDRLSSIIRISKKTIYSIFATKEILIDKIIQYKLLSIDKEIETILNKNKCPIKSFYEINQLHIKISSDVDIDKLVELKIKYPKIWSRVEDNRKNKVDMMNQIFSKAAKMGYVRNKSTIDSVSHLYMNIVNRTFQPDFFYQEDLSLKDTIDLFADIMAKGIFNNKGIDILESIKEENN
tara:strand:+ start:745 stop:1353 length:609 start_codon:yes stop_codon:yes gene_type:complete